MKGRIQNQKSKIDLPQEVTEEVRRDQSQKKQANPQGLFESTQRAQRKHRHSEKEIKHWGNRKKLDELRKMEIDFARACQIHRDEDAE